MQSAKQKVSDMASVAKEKIQIAKAKAEEKPEKAAAGTKEEKIIADEKEKLREAEAKAEMHDAKATHTAEKLEPKQTRGHHYHVPGTCVGHDPYGSTQRSHNHSVLGGATTTTTQRNPLGYPPAYNKHL